MALYDEARGYGVRAFLNPAGVRRLRLAGQPGVCAASAAWHPEGRWLVIAQSDGWSLWDVGNDNLAAQRAGYFLRSLDFLPNGNGFLTGGTKGPLLWAFQVHEGKPLVGEPRELLPADFRADERAVISPDGNTFAAVGTGGTFIGTIDGKRPPTTIPNAADSLKFSPDGRWLCTGSHGATNVLIYSVASGLMVANLPSRLPLPWFVPGRDELLVREFDELVCWQVGTWKLLRRLKAQDTPIPDGPGLPSEPPST